MKVFADFLPVLLFFATYFLGEWAPQTAHEIAVALLGTISRDGVIPPEQSSILLASAMAVVVITLQIAVLLARRKKINPMLWTSFAVFVIFGGATVYFHDDVFIKWKPTVLYWIFALALGVSEAFAGRNLVRALMEPQGFVMPEALWRRVNWAWSVYFALVGVLNLYVAFNLSRGVWVGFKSFGLTGLMVLFVAGQVALLARYMVDDAAKPPAQGAAKPVEPSQPSQP